MFDGLAERVEVGVVVDVEGRGEQRVDLPCKADRSAGSASLSVTAALQNLSMGYRGKVVEQNRARELRAQGWTLSEICDELGVSKASASVRSEEHTSELQSLMRISYAVFGLKKKQSGRTDKRAEV